MPPVASAVSHDSAPARPRLSVAIVAAALLAAALASYWNSFTVPLLLDDIASLQENPSIRKLWPLTDVLTPPANVGLGGRPIANLSFALNYAAHGTAVFGYHVVNLAIHLAAALTLFGLVRRTLATPALQRNMPESARLPVAFFAALLWLVHPLHTEAVTYISQRTESLMGLCYLFTLYAFHRGATGGRGWFAFAAIACACGMATKEVMVTAPVLVLLYDRTFLSGSFRAAWARHRSVYLALAATWMLLAFLLVDVHARGIGYKTLNAWEYLLIESRAIVHYLRLAFWPDPLVFDYGTEFPRTLRAWWPHAFAVCALLAASAIALWRRPVLGFVGAWVFITLSPTSSIVPVAGQPIAEHRMYLPLAVLAAATAILGYHRLRRGAGVALTVLALAAGTVTIARNHDYRTALALWTDTVAKVPHNARAHAGLGAAHLAQGDLAAAIPALQRALQLDPQIAEAHNNLATALTDAGRPLEAVPRFEAALRLQPETASTYYNFGNLLLQLGRLDDAIARQQQALARQAEFPEAECALGNALTAAGRLPDAIIHYETAVRLQPDFAAARFGLGNALLNSRRPAEAIPHYEATVLLMPQFADARFNLANALALNGSLAAAIPHYEAALELRPDFPAARTNLEAVRKAAAAGK